MTVKIKIIGKDKQGWSVDKDHFYNKKALSEQGYKIVSCFLNADIILNVWYSYILKRKFYFLRKFKNNRKIINIITNDPEENKKNITKYFSFTDFWICANNKQKQFLLNHKISPEKIFINPFYVDENIFKNLKKSKKEICNEINLDFTLIQNKFIIGSFQRDSRGDDLTKAKWHKNPDMIVDILKETDRSKIILLLAGPRRHYLINQCKLNQIPYLFIGNENFVTNLQDDINENNLSESHINLLYNLIDLYVITSVSEGGPKAVTEASLCKIPILSTPVGMASDLLIPESICSNTQCFIEKINDFNEHPGLKEQFAEKNYEKIININNFKAYKQRLKNIIETVSNAQ
jgi:glycosyltransferase involved in cell wall biosynthesis